MTDNAFDFIRFPETSPVTYGIMGHSQFYKNTVQGSLILKLRVLTPVHVSAGISALGSDVGEASVPMVRPMVQAVDGKLIIQGSSLKGCVRSIYEVITNSRCGTAGEKDAHIPFKYRAMKYERENGNLCSAGNVFGAMGYQGLVSFSDAVCEGESEIGYLRPMFSPKEGSRDGSTIGRKFYCHKKLVRRDEKSVVAVQQAKVGAEFSTRIQIRNLGLDEFGALLIALGLDTECPIGLKIGAGKAQGMGSVRVVLDKMNVVESENLVASRYQSYEVNCNQDGAEDLIGRAIAAAHGSLIHREQLDELFKILKID